MRTDGLKLARGHGAWTILEFTAIIINTVNDPFKKKWRAVSGWNIYIGMRLRANTYDA